MQNKFEKLREMEAFTVDMFNNIVEFQEKQHPAWNEDAPFEDRIKNLPLHALIFSNPDRDPAKLAPTITHWYPLHTEIQTIARYMQQVAEQPVMCDWGCNNGFIGGLIAREGLKGIGVREPLAKPSQIKNFYDKNCYEIREMPFADIDFSFDIAFCSWMSPGVNLTPQILRHKPKLIVYVYTDHVDNQGQRQVGTAEAFTELPDDYLLIDEWTINRPKDLLNEVWPDLTKSIEELRHTRIYASKAYHDITIELDRVIEPYSWERDLELALLSLEGKAELHAKGIPATY